MKALILSAVSFFSLMLCACNHPKTASTTSQAPVKVSDSGVNIVYSDSGKGDTTLLFVHGWGLNRGYWSNQVNYFNKKYRVVTIDLPGFGQSGKNRNNWTTEAYGKDIDSVISQLNLKKVVLIGHSMAGDIVLQGAVNAPDKVIGLVGVDNFKNVGYVETEKDKKEMTAAVNEMNHHFVKYASQYFNEALFYKTTPDSIKKRILVDIAKNDSVTATAAISQTDSYDELKQLAAAKKKLYLINSDYTPTDTSAFIKNKIPYKVYFIRTTGHFPMVEKPGDFNAALTDILSKL